MAFLSICQISWYIFVLLIESVSGRYQGGKYLLLPKNGTEHSPFSSPWVSIDPCTIEIKRSFPASILLTVPKTKIFVRTHYKQNRTCLERSLFLFLENKEVPLLFSKPILYFNIFFHFFLLNISYFYIQPESVTYVIFFCSSTYICHICSISFYKNVEMCASDKRKMPSCHNA